MTDPSPTVGVPPTATERPALRFAVGNTVEALQRDYLQTANHPAHARARAVLAQLRKFGSAPLSAQPLALEEVLLLLHPTLTEQELGRGDNPTPSELAAFHALTMFGVHMQGATTPMHAENQSFARACGRFYAQSESKSTKPRFDAMMVTADETARLIHIRSLVTLLRGANLGFDYGQFARDLRILLASTQTQEQFARKHGVLLRWGRDFATGGYAPALS